MPKTTINIIKPKSDDLKTEIINLDDGVLRTKATLTGTYSTGFIKDIVQGVTPSWPPVEFERTYGTGLYGLSITYTNDANTQEMELSISGSINGDGISASATFDKDFNVIESSGFGGLQMIGGNKGMVFGFPLGVEGIVRLGLEIDDDGIALTAQGEASVGFIFGDVDINSSTEIQIIDFERDSLSLDHMAAGWTGYASRNAIESNWIDERINSAFQLVGGATNHVSPLVLDLDGNGIELSHAYDQTLYFDIDNDGHAERIGWVGTDDGLLSMDHNHNGTIDDITELYGDDIMPAFDKLALHDENGGMSSRVTIAIIAFQNQ